MSDEPYSFTISESYSPKTIPMERLAEYMAALARLLGQTSNVHLETIKEGSVALVARVDQPAQPKVRERVHSLRSGSPPADARKAYADLDDMLRRDNAYGALAGGSDNVVIPFPGRRRPEPVTFGPFKQESTIDGQVYRIGGKDESKHVHIRDGDVDYSVLIATEAVALGLRHHLFGGVLRFSGTGTWFRSGEGVWELRSFRIAHFEPLDDAPIASVVAGLRSAKGHELDMEDPANQLVADRRGDAVTG